MAISQTAGSATIGVTEFFLVSGSTTQTPQTTDCIMQAWIDVSAMAAGDQFQFTIYEKLNAGTQGVAFQAIVTGAQAQRFYVFPSLLVMDGWEVGVKKLAGTDRSMTFAVRKVA